MKIKIGPFSYTFRAMTPEELADDHDGAGTWLGFHDGEREVIAISPSVSAATQAETTIHELIHAVYCLASGDRSRKTGEEEIASFLDGMLTMVWADNPELFVRLGLAISNGIRLVGAGQVIGPVPAVPEDLHFGAFPPFAPYAAAPPPIVLDGWGKAA